MGMKYTFLLLIMMYAGYAVDCSNISEDELASIGEKMVRENMNETDFQKMVEEANATDEVLRRYYLTVANAFYCNQPTIPFSDVLESIEENKTEWQNLGKEIGGGVFIFLAICLVVSHLIMFKSGSYEKRRNKKIDKRKKTERGKQSAS